MEPPGFHRLAKRLAAWAACAIVGVLALWLTLLAHVHYGGMKECRRVAEGWVTGEETRRLMQYHGAAVLKITQDHVYILRESRWIPVRKRNPS